MKGANKKPTIFRPQQRLELLLSVGVLIRARLLGAAIRMEICYPDRTDSHSHSDCFALFLPSASPGRLHSS